MSPGRRRLRFAATPLATILVATIGLSLMPASPATAFGPYATSFESSNEPGWSWRSTTGGSGGWFVTLCGQTRTGCGGLIMRHPPNGFVTMYKTFHISPFPGGPCDVSYYARLWNSTGPAVARIEVLKPDYTYLSVADRTLTSGAWVQVKTNFSTSVSKDIIVRITLLGSGTSANPDVGIMVDDLRFGCVQIF